MLSNIHGFKESWINIADEISIIYCTYCKKCPVAKVVDSAEEPKFVEEKIRSCHCALVCNKT